jgi:hypothetical protein
VNTRPALQRVQAPALLQVHREHEEVRGLTTPEHHLGDEAGAERPVAEQVEVEQWGTAAARQAPLLGDEREQDQRRRRQGRPRPRGPSVLATLDQR